MREIHPPPPRAPRPEAGGDRASLLIGLLDDDSPVVVAQVRAALEQLGKRGTGALVRASRSPSPRLRARARQILLERARRRAVRRLVRYASRGEHQLETALFLLDAHGAPGEDLRGYRRVLDAFADEVVERLAAGRPPGDALVEVLAEDVGFAGARRDFHHPDNVYLHRTIERRMGMPLTLCAVYEAVARRSGIRVSLLPFPGHVLLGVHEKGRRRILDPFGGGAAVSRQDLGRYLDRHGIERRPEYFCAASGGRLFLRHVTNLRQSCARAGRTQEAEELQLVARVLERVLAVA